MVGGDRAQPPGEAGWAREVPQDAVLREAQGLPVGDMSAMEA